MKQYEIAEFIVDFIQYADDSDVKTFLNFALPNYTEIKSIMRSQERYKTELIWHLFSRIYCFIENDESQDILKMLLQKEKGDDADIDLYFNSFMDVSDCLTNYRSLYLHLYALCENYHSYMLIKSKTKIDKNFYTGLLQKDISTQSVKDSSIQNVFKILINNYKKNKFYYMFFNDKLFKLSIYYDKVNDLYRYRTSKYNLVDEKDKTYIIKKADNIKKPLYKVLLRRNYIENYLNIQVEQTITGISFKHFQKFHEQIVSVLKMYNPRHCTEKNIQTIYNSCQDLHIKWQVLCDSIADEEPVKKILDVKSYDYKSLFSYKDDYKTLSKQQVVQRIKSELCKKIDSLKKEIEKTEDEVIYGQTIDAIKAVEEAIEKLL